MATSIKHTAKNNPEDVTGHFRMIGYEIPPV